MSLPSGAEVEGKKKIPILFSELKQTSLINRSLYRDLQEVMDAAMLRYGSVLHREDSKCKCPELEGACSVCLRKNEEVCIKGQGGPEKYQRSVQRGAEAR